MSELGTVYLGTSLQDVRPRRGQRDIAGGSLRSCERIAVFKLAACFLCRTFGARMRRHS